MVKVISWNIAHREEAWRALCDTDADIALVQEATEPPADMPPSFEYRPATWRTAGAGHRPWRAAVVKLSNRIDVQWLEPTPIENARDGDLTVSRAGTLDAAIVTPPTGEAFVVVSMYALWEKPHPTTSSSWIYADGSVHRLISDISVFVGQQLGHRILAAGDHARSRLTPYVGIGAGIGLTELDYGDLWARNPDPGAIGTAAGLLNDAEIRRNLAATTTSKQAELHDRLTGYQVLGGADYALSEAVSLGVKIRWVRFGRFTADDIEWERLRSHASQLRLDGSELVTFRIRTDGALSLVGVSLSMRYTF